MRELDPNAIRKDNRISKDVRVDVFTKPYCYTCTNTTPLTSFCKDCKKELKHEISKWTKIETILNYHYSNYQDQLSLDLARKFHFPKEECDYTKIMENDSFKNVSFYQKDGHEEFKHDVESESSEDSEEEERKTNDFKEQFLSELAKNKQDFDKKAIIITDILQDESFAL